MGRRSKSFVTGAAILTLATFISKVLGAIYRIPYQNIVGDVGLAAYNKVYPLYSILLILATAGFPVAISKLVAEQLTLGDKVGARRILTASIYVLSISGVLFFLMLFFGASFVANLMGNPNLTIVIKSVSFALLIVPVMSAIRGFYQGHQYMVPTAYSLVIEQIVRVITILFLSYFFIEHGYSIYHAAAGATFGAFTGGIVGIILLLFFWKKTKNISNEIVAELAVPFYGESISNKEIVKKLFYFAIPVALSNVFLSVLGLVDSFTVSNILKQVIIKSDIVFASYLKGHTLTYFAEYWFGIYSRGQALVQFAAFFASALAIALVPSITESKVKNDMVSVNRRSELALRITLMLGLPAAVGIIALARPINILLYKDGIGSTTIAIYALVVIFSTLFVTSAGILQGLGQVMLPAKHLFLGIFVKIILNVVLVYYYGINGAVMATISAYLVASGLNLNALKKHISLRISWSSFFIKPVIATVVMGVLVYLTRIGLTYALEPVVSSGRILNLYVTLAGIFVGVVVYGVSLFATGSLTRKDLAYIPGYGNKIIKITEKLRILRD